MLFLQMNYLSTVMESTYSTAKICDVDEDPETCVPSLELEPGTHVITIGDLIDPEPNFDLYCN